MKRPPTPIVRQVTAQEYALRQYAVAYDRIEAIERRLLVLGLPFDAAGARVIADHLLTAYQLELTDPQPAGLA